MVLPSYSTHGERKHFACEFYRQHMGALPPVQSGMQHGRAHHIYLSSILNIPLKEAMYRDK